MHDIPLEQMQKRIAELPENVRAILFAKETVKNIETIGRQNRLMIDQIGDLSEEISLVIMGFVKPKDLATNLVQKINIDPDVARTIVTEINTQIFSKIREELMKLGGEEPAPAPIKPEAKPSMPPAPPIVSPATPKIAPPVPQPVPATPPAPPTIASTPTLPIISAPVPVPMIVPKAPAVPKIDATPFEQKLKDGEVFHAPAQVSVHEAPPAIIKPVAPEPAPVKPSLPPLPKKEEIRYGGKDPYKEPIE